jgi:purine-binding chemotaxis protein CheW
VLLVLARIQIAKSGAGGRHAIRPKYGNESRDRLMAIETRSGEVMAPGRPILMGSDQRQASATVLLCRAGSHHFALPMQHVVETMRMLPVETVAGCPPIVLGISVIRGAPTPVIDAALLFDGQPGRYERLVTVRTGKRTIALATQAVVGVREMADDDLDDLPPLLGSVEEIAGLTTLDQHLVFLLRAARIISDDVLDQLEATGARA